MESTQNQPVAEDHFPTEQMRAMGLMDDLPRLGPDDEVASDAPTEGKNSTLSLFFLYRKP
jgi:hypothetical protein